VAIGPDRSCTTPQLQSCLLETLCPPPALLAADAAQLPMAGGPGTRQGAITGEHEAPPFLWVSVESIHMQHGRLDRPASVVTNQ